jgi:tripartite-type tricarboxylate transporter receptor subunit TctC
MAPAATPKAVVERLYQVSAHMMATPEMREKFAAIGAVAVGNRPEEFGAQVAADLARWKELIARAKLATD